MNRTASRRNDWKEGCVERIGGQAYDVRYIGLKGPNSSRDKEKDYCSTTMEKRSKLRYPHNMTLVIAPSADPSKTMPSSTTKPATEESRLASQYTKR